MLLAAAMLLAMMPTVALAAGSETEENYVTLELTYGDNVTGENQTKAKTEYEGRKYTSCAEANEAYMALYGVTWEKGYLDVTDRDAPLYAYIGQAGSVTNVTFEIHGTVEGFDSLYSQGNQIDCTVGGNHQIFRTSYTIRGAGGADGSKAAIIDGNVQAYVAGGYYGNGGQMFADTGTLIVENIEFLNTNTTTIAASCNVDSEAAAEGKAVKSASMVIKGCTFHGLLYLYSNFLNNGKMEYTVEGCDFIGTESSQSYAIFLQNTNAAADLNYGPSKLTLSGNTISGYERGINLHNASTEVQVKSNKISTAPGYSAVQITACTAAEITGNQIHLDNSNVLTLHELLAGYNDVEVTVSNNTIDGNGYLIYDDVAANGGALTSDKFTLTLGTDDAANTFNGTIDTTKGVKGNAATDLIGYVAAVARGDDVEGKAAEVGGVYYENLTDAFAALNKTDHTLTLLDGSAWTDGNVYWQAGENNDGYAATLADALKSAYMANGDDITIICKPGSDVGTMTHGHVADNITLYGNNAYISGGECDLEVDTYQFNRATGAQSSTGDYLSRDIMITAYELDNLGVWGQRNTEHTVTVNLIDCDGREISDQSDNLQRVYISGTRGVNNITLTDCDFITAATAVYSNADGSITIDGCSFTDGQAPVNFNHKDEGEQTVTVKNSTFTACGDDNTWKTFAAPLRFVNSGSGSQTVTVDSTTITDTVGSNGDILLGDGRTGEQSKGVSLTITNTEAEVQAQKPGYYGADGSVSDTSQVRKTSVVKSTTPVTITLDNGAFDLAQVGDTGYSNLTDAISAAQSGGKTVALLTADDVLLQAILDGQYGSIDGLTIELPTGSYEQLELGRATKYAGSNTEYYVGGFDESAANYQKFDSAEELTTYKNGGGWTPNCYYVRNMSDVTLKAAAGADVEIAGMTATAGHIYGTSGAPVTDYVLDTETENTVGSYYLAQNWGNITFDGLTFTAKVDIASSLEKTAIDGVSFRNCSFDINNTASGNQALRYYNELDNEKVSGLTVDNCTFTNCFQGVYTQKIKNITVTNSTFDTTAHNAIAIQSGDNAANHGDVVITNNTFTNIGDRIIRFNNVAEGTNITITDNTATNSGDETGEVIKATSVAEGVTTTIYSNNWGPGTKVGNDEFRDTAAPSSGGSSSYTITTKDTDNGSISVSPSRASSGRTVTITVEPDDGYALDELNVTDSKGEKVELTKVSDTKYTFTMPRSRVTIEATFVEINHADICPSADFTDVDMDAWYHDAVDYAIENGMMNGVGNNLFAPDSNLSRAMLVQVLWNLEGNPDVSTITEYSDVASDAWYYNAVQWATAENIVGGYGNGIYGPEDDITREQMALMLYRYAQYKGYDTTQSGADVEDFADYEDISDWALEGVTWAVNAGLLNGKGNGILDPTGDATRAEVAQILMNFCENIVE